MHIKKKKITFFLSFFHTRNILTPLRSSYGNPRGIFPLKVSNYSSLHFIPSSFCLHPYANHICRSSASSSSSFLSSFLSHPPAAFFPSFNLLLFSFFTSALLFLLPSSSIPPCSSHLFLLFLPPLHSPWALLFSSSNCSFVSFSIPVPSHHSFIFYCFNVVLSHRWAHTLARVTDRQLCQGAMHSWPAHKYSYTNTLRGRTHIYLCAVSILNSISWHSVWILRTSGKSLLASFPSKNKSPSLARMSREERNWYWVFMWRVLVCKILIFHFHNVHFKKDLYKCVLAELTYKWIEYSLKKIQIFNLWSFLRVYVFNWHCMRAMSHYHAPVSTDWKTKCNQMYLCDLADIIVTQLY